MTFITRLVVVKQAVARKKTCDQARDTVMIPVLVDMKLNRDEGPPRGCQNEMTPQTIPKTLGGTNKIRIPGHQETSSDSSRLRFTAP